MIGLKNFLCMTILTLSLAETVVAQDSSDPVTIVSCGSSTGHAYFHSGGIIGEDDAGWSQDAIGNGSLIVQLDGEDFDLIYRDQIGLNSASDNGAFIVPTHYDESSLVLIVTYPQNGNTEVYNFQKLRFSNSEVSWTSTKVGALINKSSVFYAKCQK